jgi:hypothetical protein
MYSSEKKLTILGILLLVSGGISLYARADYTWASSVIKKTESKGWHLVSKQDNISFLSRPWTIIKPPVLGVWFINPKRIMRVDEDIVVAEVLRTQRQADGSTESEAYVNIFDCQNYQAFSPDDITKVRQADLKSLDWFQHEHGTPGGDLLDFVTAQLPVSPRGSLDSQ